MDEKKLKKSEYNKKHYNKKKSEKSEQKPEELEQKPENIEKPDKSFFFQTLKNKLTDMLITMSIPIIIKLGANLFMKRSKQEPKQEEPLQQFTFPPLNF